jgi:hypothetical protein
VQFVLLLFQIAKVNEKPRAHVFLGRAHFGVIRNRLVASDKQIAVLQKATTSYFLRRFGRNQLVVQVKHGLFEVAVHRLG